MKWQARVTMSVSAFRVLILAAGAYLLGDLRTLILLLLVIALLKLLLLLGYVARVHGLGAPWLNREMFLNQIRGSAPFGISSALYGLRVQADQWVAASLFTLQSFAAFSVASVLGPLVGLFRQSFNHAFLPSMSRFQAEGNLRGMLALNSRANVMVGVMVYPLLAFAFVFAEEIVTLIYTSTYVEAAAVMRVYIIGLAAFVVEVVSIMLLLKEGAYALRINVLIFVLSVGLSWLAAHHLGLAGAAAGSVFAIYCDRFATLSRIAKQTGIPLRQLQDWGTLGLLILFSALAAALAWIITNHFVLNSVMLRLLVGSTVLAAAYALLPIVFGMGRGWLVAACNPQS